MESDEEQAAGDAPEVIAETLKREIAHERKRNEELLTRLKYMQADLENSRKRMEKDMKEAGESLARTLAAKLLTVGDEMELAVKHAKKGKPGAEIIEGLGMVKRNLEAALESVGVQRIESVGTPFDPSLHEAVEKVQGKAQGKDIVMEEVRPGYTFRGQLLRPSMVKVELGSKAAKEEAKASE
ncbi:MAG TPA: nucleotide exchange factor GrpE [Nitrososphaerales archaeon]|nr:nucleotide exchange factor GrpE [Nitrososphaerales archaeon]